ncbi:hypothetical protein CFC21_049392 [Triticum aestivum]|uniref:RING-type domain-containing protein n=2 Tax=Triticum aestivum TaxID=4565 RepID=A0A9R1G2N9_WHEAT|nr:E3 ubiquitin-protein ligase CHFR-like [Triticum aestivum]KAF7039388.1 hypothetical protein CFC21_049392 [Triticum aestivum]
MDRRPELRRAMTLKEQLSTPAEPAIRDFLRIPDDDDDEERPCTLMDAIDRDVRGEGGAGGAINWRPLRHRLWLRRAAGAWHAAGSETKPSAAASRAAPRSSGKSNYTSGEASAAFSRAPSLRAVVDDEGGSDVEEEAEDNDLPPPAAASTSLMTLMEQADGHWDEAGEDGGASRCGSVEDNDEDGRGERHEEEEEEELQVCCVCMVRHKGAAFIPCGHTFCRLCSRELRHTRGNCPLCNVFIQDILHIF